MGERLSDLADALWPHLARRVAGRGGAAAAVNVASPTDHGALTGLLDDDHTQYLTAGRGDGRYAALADWTTHIGNADAHHARLHVLATNTGLGGDHTISGATAGHVLRASSATAAAFAQLAHSDLSGIGTNTHTNIDTHIATADIHVAHSGVSMSAGDGLTGGGSIAASRSFAVALSAVSGLELTGTAGSRTLQLADSVAGAGLASNNKVLSVGVANTGAAGLTVEADAVRLTSSSNPGAAAAVLATDSNGYLRLARLGIGMAPAYPLDVSGDVRLSGTLYADGAIVDFGTDYFQEGATYLELKGAKPFYLNQTIQASGWSMSAGGALVSSSSLSAASMALTGAATVGGNLTVGSTVLQVDAAGTRVGINRAADSQFDLDVAGAIRGQYLVGKHAIQLAAATAVVHFDGPAPYTLDFTGSNASHVGEGATETGGVIYRPGRYGKAVQMGQATTNFVQNPSFETGTAGYWTAYNSPTLAQSADALYGGFSLSMTTGAVISPYIYRGNSGATLATGQAWTFSAWVKAGNSGAVGKTVTLRLRENDTLTTAATATLTAAWQRVQVTRTLTEATPTSLNHWIQITSTAGSGDVMLVDGVQLERLAYATAYCDGALGQGHAWSGTAHASTSSRTATKLEYPIRMVNPQAGTIMMWVNVDGYNGGGGGLWGWGSANGTMDAFINSAGTLVSRVGGSTPSSVATFGVGTWRHVAWTWDAAANVYRVFVDGVQQGSDYTYAAQPVHATALAVGGVAALSSTYTHNGLLDEFVLLDYAADPKLVRAIYESDAPVFVESSVFHWRSPSKVPIWVDEFGLWARGVSGGAILGLYGGDPRTVGATTSWGGITMEENDIVIGRTSAPAYTALHWDDSAGELILGRQAAEHVSLVSGSVRIKNATTVYADLTGSTFVLGNVAEENLRLTTSGIEFRNATEVQGSLSATTWTLGKTTGNHVLITATSLDIKYGSTAKISLDASGNASFTGAITAASGTVGGWTIGASTLAGGNATLANTGKLTLGTSNDVLIADAGDATYRLYIGNAAAASAPFSVTKAGALKATSGTIGGWTLSTTALSSTGITITPGAANVANIKAGTGGFYEAGINAMGAGSDVAFWAGALYADRSTAPFRVLGDGSFTSTLGSIGGWTVAATSIASGGITLTPGAVNVANIATGAGSNKAGINAASATATDVTFWSGSSYADRATAPFRTQVDGKLYATNAEISGTITASGGSITGVLSVGASGEIRQGSGSLGSNFTGLRIWTDTSVGRIAGYNNNTTQWTAGTDGRMYAGADKLRMDATGVSLLQPAINGAFSETEMTTNAAALRWLPSLFSAWTAASDLSALYAYRETGGNSNDVAIVSRVGSDNYTTRTARVLLQPMLWTGSVFKQANLIASINNTDSQLTWDGTKFALIGSYMDIAEISTPGNPAANQARIYVRDNGSGKTWVTVRFSDGYEVDIAKQV